MYYRSMRLPRRTFKPCTSPYLAVTSNPYAAHSSRVPVVHQSFCPDLPGPPTKQWQACLHEHRGERVETPIGNRPSPHFANLRYCRQPVLFHSPTPPSIRPSVHPSFHPSCTSCRTVLVGIPPPYTAYTPRDLQQEYQSAPSGMGFPTTYSSIYWYPFYQNRAECNTSGAH